MFLRTTGFSIALLVLATATSYAQVGIGTTTPDAKAALDISASGKGLLIPRMDSLTRVGIANPPAGLLVFQNDQKLPGFWYYFGGQWIYLRSGGDNLGNHKATQDIDLGTHQLVGNGGTTGLTIRANGNVMFPGRIQVDTTGSNGATFHSGIQFGPSNTGEGIANNRTGNGVNQFGLDFYTSYTNRLAISNSGQVGINTTSPTSTLQVAGTLAVGVISDIVGGSSASATSLSTYSGGYLTLNPSAGNDTYQLPDPTTCSGRIYYLRNNSASSSAYIRTAANAIYPATSSTALTAAYQMQPSASSKTVVAISDGVNWTLGAFN